MLLAIAVHDTAAGDLNLWLMTLIALAAWLSAGAVLDRWQQEQKEHVRRWICRQ